MTHHLVEEALDRAFLESAPPDRVYDWLREHKGRALPAATTKSLLAREDRFIDLGLAQYCPEEESLRELFDRGNSALRCSILSNHRHYHDRLRALFTGRHLVKLFPTDEDLVRFLAEAPFEQILAYLMNPGLQGIVLKNLFLRSDALRDLPDERWHELVLAALHNPVLRTDSESVEAVRVSARLGGGPDPMSPGHAMQNPLGAAWEVLAILPTTPELADVLVPAVRVLDFGGASFVGLGQTTVPTGVTDWREYARTCADSFLSRLLAKWATSGAEGNEPEFFGRMRQAVAEAVTTSEWAREIADGFACSSDRSVRAGYYSAFRPSKLAELEAALERDGILFVENAVQNPWFFLRSTQKPIFRRMSAIAEGTKTGFEGGPSTFWPMFQHRGEALANADSERYAFDLSNLLGRENDA